MGAVLAGDDAFVAEARRAKHLFGGALRQAGIAAAAGLYALDHHVERLAEDHKNAALLADRLRELDGITVAAPDTNIVLIGLGAGLPDADELVDRCCREGVQYGVIDARTLRAVTHLDVDAAGVERAAGALAAQLAAAPSAG